MDLPVIDLMSQRVQGKGFKRHGARVRTSSEQNPMGVREEKTRDDGDAHAVV